MLYFVREMLKLAFSRDYMTTPATPNFDMTLAIPGEFKNKLTLELLKINNFFSNPYYF